MKKKFIIFCAVLTSLSIAAFAAIDWETNTLDPLQASVTEDLKINQSILKNIEKTVFTDFIYDIGPRFSPIKKEAIEKATTIRTFFSEDELQKMEVLKSVNIILIINDEQSKIREIGYSDELTAGQMALLQSSNYSTSFLIRAEYKEKKSANWFLGK
ncbi:hypothetical protein [Changchengzhania lutea]|uniref:hypothetical protein n=1 Tax=Changchengzhania lutea TaxID=2049305 RepID=UPI00115D922D|nr:hypothetical protein [Changchengzhania lutea]